jgi:PAS domain S-box-containing protein
MREEYAADVPLWKKTREGIVPAGSSRSGFGEGFEPEIAAMLASSYDVIYTSNAAGVTQKVSDACKTLWGMEPSDMVGRSVFELEREGIFQPSVTRMVLETGQRTHSLQMTKTGRKLIVVGTPIKDARGRILEIVNLSRDVTSENTFRAEMSALRRMLDACARDSAAGEGHARTNRLIFVSEAMSKVADIARKVSGVDSTVLITGESGVGKEVLASFIHANSKRKKYPFLKINCGAIPASLIESELFGYERGAFTGANRDGKPGVFELAHKGVLLLDEISELPTDMQVKLLRVLQDGVVTRLGGVRPTEVDARIIAASNKDLEKEMNEGRFRRDLYYRLNVVPIHIPALRERVDDIPLLASFFLDRCNDKYAKNKVFAADVFAFLKRQRWEGNVRELQNIVERLVVLTDEEEITLAHLPQPLTPASYDAPGVTVDRIIPLKAATDSVERQLIRMAMEKFSSTVKAAEVLGVAQSTISRKLKKTH